MLEESDDDSSGKFKDTSKFTTKRKVNHGETELNGETKLNFLHWYLKGLIHLLLGKTLSLGCSATELSTGW